MLVAAHLFYVIVSWNLLGDEQTKSCIIVHMLCLYKLLDMSIYRS